jgi:hypothetical protein
VAFDGSRAISGLNEAGTSRERPRRGSNDSRASRFVTSPGVLLNAASLSVSAARTVESGYDHASAAIAAAKHEGTVTLGDDCMAFAARMTFDSMIGGVSVESGQAGRSIRAGVVDAGVGVVAGFGEEHAARTTVRTARRRIMQRDDDRG